MIRSLNQWKFWPSLFTHAASLPIFTSDHRLILPFSILGGAGGGRSARRRKADSSLDIHQSPGTLHLDPIPVATLRPSFSASFVGPFAVSRTFSPSVSSNVTLNRVTSWSTPTELKICSCLARGYSPEGCAKPRWLQPGFHD